MRLLIDGYNLLHQSDLMGTGHGAAWLERARQRLIDTIAAYLEPQDLPQTTIVFDRHSGKQIDAHQVDSSGIQILYAVDHPEADDLIEDLIAKSSHPKQLTVVSSDHRLQKAIDRRGGKSVDADIWYERLLAGQVTTGAKKNKQGRGNRQAKRGKSHKPDSPLTDEQLARWLDRFNADAIQDELSSLAEEPSPIPKPCPPALPQPKAKPAKKATKQKPQPKPPKKPAPPRSKKKQPATKPDDLSKRKLQQENYNPFPEGYTDDLWEE
ncbi:NYN domain-containing protein [Rosistilla oblonga]|uniref:NYN domain-containing protein n=1 Tax=Rosistilla oblonga TaxID=2527990 RepID=UPI003A9766EB